LFYLDKFNYLMKTFVIIPAAGSGSRINSKIPKQFIKVAGKEILAYTLEIFQNNENIDKIIVATKPQYFDLITNLKEKYSFGKIAKIVEGGVKRQDSVYNALKNITADKNDLIIVHDAARPLLSQSLLNKAIEEAKNSRKIVIAVKARDTLIEGNDYVDGYLDRKKIYYAQTPQIFSFDILINSMNNAYKDNFVATDESMIVEKYAGSVKIVEGESINFKITTDSDLKIFMKIVE